MPNNKLPDAHMRPAPKRACEAPGWGKCVSILLATNKNLNN